MNKYEECLFCKKQMVLSNNSIKFDTVFKCIDDACYKQHRYLLTLCHSFGFVRTVYTVGKYQMETITNFLINKTVNVSVFCSNKQSNDYLTNCFILKHTDVPIFSSEDEVEFFVEGYKLLK